LQKKLFFLVSWVIWETEVLLSQAVLKVRGRGARKSRERKRSEEERVC